MSGRLHNYAEVRAYLEKEHPLAASTATRCFSFAVPRRNPARRWPVPGLSAGYAIRRIAPEDLAVIL